MNFQSGSIIYNSNRISHRTCIIAAMPPICRIYQEQASFEAYFSSGDSILRTQVRSLEAPTDVHGQIALGHEASDLGCLSRKDWRFKFKWHNTGADCKQNLTIKHQAIGGRTCRQYCRRNECQVVPFSQRLVFKKNINISTSECCYIL